MTLEGYVETPLLIKVTFICFLPISVFFNAHECKCIKETNMDEFFFSDGMKLTIRIKYLLFGIMFLILH